MSKVKYSVHHKSGMDGICHGTCGHYWSSIYGTRISPIKKMMSEPCPVCAEIEKRVKTARVEALREVFGNLLTMRVENNPIKMLKSAQDMVVKLTKAEK